MRIGWRPAVVANIYDGVDNISCRIWYGNVQHDIVMILL